MGLSVPSAASFAAVAVPAEGKGVCSFALGVALALAAANPKSTPRLVTTKIINSHLDFRVLKRKLPISVYVMVGLHGAQTVVFHGIANGEVIKSLKGLVF